MGFSTGLYPVYEVHWQPFGAGGRTDGRTYVRTVTCLLRHYQNFFLGRRHNTLFHTVFDVVLVQLNEWIPVLLKCR